MLYLIKVLKGQRTVYSPLHILNGKRSSQPIQDARLYGLDAYFAVFPKLSREEWELHLQNLKKLGLIEQAGELTYLCSDSGLAALGDWQAEYQAVPHLNGFHFKESASVFWARLQLLVQVLSCMVHQTRSFIPVQRHMDHQRFVKVWLKQDGRDYQLISHELYTELLKSLDRLPGIGPELIVMLLTGHERAGMTLGQAAQKLGIDRYYAQIVFLDTLHYIMASAQKEPFRLLNSLSMQNEGQDETVLTNSTKATWRLVKQGLTIEQIAKARRLKVNTVEDHIVEIASFIDGFDITEYVTEEEQRLIMDAAAAVNTGQLRSIKERLPEGFPYFKIRLVMTKQRGGDKYGDA